MRISEALHLIPLIESKDYGTAGIDSDGVHMGKDLHGLTAVFTFGVVTGNSTLKVYEGATTGAKTTALAFKYRLGNGDYKAANADVLGAFTSVASTGLLLTAATFDHRMVTVEVDSDQMTDGYPWLVFEIDNVANPLNVAAVGVGQARYPGQTQPTTL